MIFSEPDVQYICTDAMVELVCSAGDDCSKDRLLQALTAALNRFVREKDIPDARDYPGREHVLYTGIDSPAEY